MIKKNKNFRYIKQLKFVSVGIVNTIFGYLLYASLITLELAPQAALFLATIGGFIFNYFSFGRFVFSKAHRPVIFFRFAFAYAIAYLVNAISLHFMLDAINLNAFYAQIFCIPLAITVTWVLLNYWVFQND